MWYWAVLAVALLTIVLLWWRRSDSFTLKEIPKTIWTYWDTEELPDFIQKCIDKWRQLNPGWTINVLNPKNLGEHLPGVDIFGMKFADSKPRQSDFVRLHVMAKYGGIWCDASMVPTRSFEWVIDAQKSKGSEFIGYYREGATTRPEYPVIESWFFANIPGSNFVSKWRDELGVMNTLEKESDYKEHVKARGVDIQDTPQPDYLNVYLSAQAVMQTQMTPDEIRDKIHVLKAEDGPFEHSVSNNWDPAKSVQSLCAKSPAELPDLIKIYGNERRAMESDPSLQCVNKIFTRDVDGIAL
jgi:hypothetical protein